jgi:hypothetical protein
LAWLLLAGGTVPQQFGTHALELLVVLLTAMLLLLLARLLVLHLGLHAAQHLSACQLLCLLLPQQPLLPRQRCCC